MRLAHKVGLHVAPVQLRLALGKDVLLIERFDRIRHDSSWRRRAMVSALTLFELDEMMTAYASYEKLSEIIRHRFKDAKATLRESFARIVFNILCGNADDHARVSRPRKLIHRSERSSQVATCIASASSFLLGWEEAISIANH
jgi:serine/threonine-protein kinase HipA